MNTMKKILVLTANLKDTKQPHLDQEVVEITEALQRSNARDQFEIHTAWAVHLRDLRRALLDHEPQIVHFCGHGKVAGILSDKERCVADKRLYTNFDFCGRAGRRRRGLDRCTGHK